MAKANTKTRHSPKPETKANAKPQTPMLSAKLSVKMKDGQLHVQASSKHCDPRQEDSITDTDLSAGAHDIGKLFWEFVEARLKQRQKVFADKVLEQPDLFASSTSPSPEAFTVVKGGKDTEDSKDEGAKIATDPNAKTGAPTVANADKIIDIIKGKTEEDPLMTLDAIIDRSGLPSTEVINIVESLKTMGLIQVETKTSADGKRLYYYVACQPTDVADTILKLITTRKGNGWDTTARVIMKELNLSEEVATATLQRLIDDGKLDVKGDGIKAAYIPSQPATQDGGSDDTSS